jgi:hypothetical protein
MKEARLPARNGHLEPAVQGGMHPPEYYRGQARHARELANRAHPGAVRDTLLKAAQDFDEIAEDLEAGAIEVRHPELMPGRRGRAGPAEPR